MTIKAYCQGCDKTYQVKDTLAGKRGKCPKGHPLIVPDVSISPGASAAHPTSAMPAATRADVPVDLPATFSVVRQPKRNLVFAGSIAGGIALVLLIGTLGASFFFKANAARNDQLADEEKRIASQAAILEGHIEAATNVKQEKGNSPEGNDRNATRTASKEKEKPPKIVPEKKPAEPLPVKKTTPRVEPPVTPSPKDNAPSVELPMKTSDPTMTAESKDGLAFILPFEAVGNVERIATLKVVRLAGVVSFTTALNVNNVTLTYCWEPAISVRFEEFNETQFLKLKPVFDMAQGNQGIKTKINEALRKDMSDGKKRLNLSAEVGRKLDYEVGVMLKKGDYRSFLETKVFLRGDDVFQAFNQLRVPLANETGMSMRNLCYALSISNLVPLRDKSFKISPGPGAEIKGKVCRTFVVEDPKGAKLDFAFDKATDLLAEISHRGSDPRLPGKTVDSQWTHRFSDYRVIDGIKQWHVLQVHINDLLYATIRVNSVQYLDEIPLDMKQAFEMVSSKDKDDEKAAERLFNSAKTALASGNAIGAKVLLRRFLEDYPSNKHAAEAKKLLATISP